jgi:hypothetical protein
VCLFSRDRGGGHVFTLKRARSPGGAAEDLADQCRQPAAPVKTAQLELSPIGELESGAREQVANGGGDHDFARLRCRRIRAAAWTAIPLTSSPSSSTSPAWTPARAARPCAVAASTMARRTAHRTGRAVEEDDEAVTSGLRLASTKALDLRAHCLVVLG